mmetsp:Transcript_9378/g.19192  ORF Transcript_9378/g.19192 Transcript_9378/m.19192 type:complete len:86 (+) Transcript_9378:791-1048(+)
MEDLNLFNGNYPPRKEAAFVGSIFDEMVSGYDSKGNLDVSFRMDKALNILGGSGWRERMRPKMKLFVKLERSLLSCTTVFKRYTF